jgi:hypothetical protein
MPGEDGGDAAEPLIAMTVNLGVQVSTFPRDQRPRISGRDSPSEITRPNSHWCPAPPASVPSPRPPVPPPVPAAPPRGPPSRPASFRPVPPSPRPRPARRPPVPPSRPTSLSPVADPAWPSRRPAVPLPRPAVPSHVPCPPPRIPPGRPAPRTPHAPLVGPTAVLRLPFFVNTEIKACWNPPKFPRSWDSQAPPAGAGGILR